MNPYEASNFRDVLRLIIENKKALNPEVNYSKIAKEIKVQRAYISQVMNGKGTFNSDQVYSISKYLNLNSTETEYLQLLTEKERSGLNERKRLIDEKCKDIKKALISNQRNIQGTVVKSDEDNSALSWNEYYLDPYCSIFHMYLTIPKYIANPTTIGELFNLSPTKTAKVLKTLIDCGILELNSNGYLLRENAVYLKAEDALRKFHSGQFRSISQQYCQKADSELDTFYTATFSADEKTRQWIKEKFKKFIEEINYEIKAADSSAVFQLNFDLFKF